MKIIATNDRFCKGAEPQLICENVSPFFREKLVTFLQALQGDSGWVYSCVPDDFQVPDPLPPIHIPEEYA